MFLLATILIILFLLSATFLGFAIILARDVYSHPDGTAEMKKISDPIKEGAQGFFRTQYTTITMLALCLAAIILVSLSLRHAEAGAALSPSTYAMFATAAFLTGGFMSGLSGLVAMALSIRANVRVCAEAANRNYPGALMVTFRGGAFAAFLIVTLCLFGLVSLVAILTGLMHVPIVQVPLLLVGYGFGGSFVALFAQLGGGIYTKAADVGADIVGKIEANIPEDDPRNPAVIADLVGDNVGDCAGRGADLFESIAAEDIGSMILAATLARSCGLDKAHQTAFTMFPLCVHALGLFASALGVLAVRVKSVRPTTRTEKTPLIAPEAGPSGGGDTDGDDIGSEDPLHVMKRGYGVAAVVSLLGMWLLCYVMLHVPEAPRAWIYFALCGSLGIGTSWVFIVVTEFYTDYYYGPVLRIAQASETGGGTNVIAGLAVGMQSTAIPVLTLSTVLLAVYWLGRAAGLSDQPAAGIFGTAVATLGMLSVSAFILAMDTFGPIADNAGGIAEMSGQPAAARVITDRLDAVGNTTKALTKGYAVGSAATAAFLLFRAYMDEISALLPAGTKFKVVDISSPEVFVAGLLGAGLVFLFSSLAIRAVGTAAEQVVSEVRRQFREIPGILAGTAAPEYGRCVALVSRAALREMVAPGLLALLTPIVVGVVFRGVGAVSGRPLLGVQAAAGTLMVGTVTAIVTALFMNNAGGAWDNAKKYVELGHYGGKGSDAHRAAVVGDTVGDPCKDTAGPSLHVLMKLLANVTLVFGPLFLGKVARA
mmetsp:Transcript_9276/g.23190  ORF Transcript_9276/g.23190 Transcript_9276/m.23190 type:complete len:766 (-) Transcript_9276:128-2425(-)